MFSRLEMILHSRKYYLFINSKQTNKHSSFLSMYYAQVSSGAFNITMSQERKHWGRSSHFS